MLQIQRFNITPLLTVIRRPETTPLKENRLPPINPEIHLPAQRAPLPTIGALGQDLVFQRERVDRVVCPRNDELDPVVPG